VADAIMIARGDLGVEMDLTRVPVIQRRIVSIARAYAKPCIVATQMLETMIERPQPTRAEASDVANAIFDEIDAVMLSGETAVGRHPTLVVEFMRQIAERTEEHLAAEPPHERGTPSRLLTQDPQAALAHGVWTVARDCGARCIVVWSQSGTSARHLSQFDFRMPIVAMSSDDRAVRQMQLLRGVSPVRRDAPANLAEFTRKVDEELLASGRVERGQRCVLVAGWPIRPEMVTNSLAIHEVGDPSSGYAWHDASE
jgi:pyruvate kinase